MSSLCDDLLFWNGAYAEFARIPARVVRKNVLPLEDGVSFRDAAMVEPLACVIRGVEESWIGRGQHVAVIGTGPIGLMFVALARMRGAHVVAAGRRRERLDKALEMGAESAVAVRADADLAELLRQRSPDGRGADVVIEAVGLPETSEAAVRAVRKGGVVQLFGGCPADTRIGIDSQRLHYQELTIKSTFHHTPESVRKAFRLIADGHLDPNAFITAEAPLERLPEVLQAMSGGGPGLKTAILPWGRES
jgi:L-iditol 2-dehydrogenase